MLSEAHYLHQEDRARRSGDDGALAHALRHLSELRRDAGLARAALAAAEEAIAIYRGRAPCPALDLANAVRLRALALEACGSPSSEAAAAWREAEELYGAAGIEAGVLEARARLGGD